MGRATNGSSRLSSINDKYEGSRKWDARTFKELNFKLCYVSVLSPDCYEIRNYRILCFPCEIRRCFDVLERYTRHQT